MMKHRLVSQVFIIAALITLSLTSYAYYQQEKQTRVHLENDKEWLMEQNLLLTNELEATQDVLEEVQTSVKQLERQVENKSAVIETLSEENKRLKEPVVSVSRSASPVKKVLSMEATAYTAYCEGCSGTTYTGQDLRADPTQKVIAVDPSVIPLGSVVWVEGYGEAIAGDIGGAIKGNIIDVFIPDLAEALKWGRRQEVEVHILN